MMCLKAIVLVSAIMCLISAEKIPLKDRIFKCKLIPFKKHHSIFESIIPSIIASPVDSAVPGEYTVPAGVTTLAGSEPVPVPTAEPVEPQQEVQNRPPQEVQYPPQPEVQYPPQPEIQYPPQPEVQYPPQPEIQYPPQPEVQYPVPQPEVQYPVSQQEGQPPAAPQQEVQNPSQQQPLYPPQHEGQRPAQHHVEQSPSSSNEGLYPPQHNGQYYQLQSKGVYYPPPNYPVFTADNVPYNYPVYGQNVLRSVKSLDGQTYTLHQSPYGANSMFIRQPSPYHNAPQVYGQYAAPQYNYVSQAPRTAQALTGRKAKST